jgi:hypothetical protein
MDTLELNGRCRHATIQLFVPASQWKISSGPIGDHGGANLVSLWPTAAWWTSCCGTWYLVFLNSSHTRLKSKKISDIISNVSRIFVLPKCVPDLPHSGTNQLEIARKMTQKTKSSLTTFNFAIWTFVDRAMAQQWHRASRYHRISYSTSSGFKKLVGRPLNKLAIG